MAIEAELEAEVALLRAEIASLRAKTAAQAVPVTWVAGQWQHAANAACAPPPAFIVRDANGMLTYTSMLPATAAGCAGPPVHAMQYFTVGT